jgi:hypothetical protein
MCLEINFKGLLKFIVTWARPRGVKKRRSYNFKFLCCVKIRDYWLANSIPHLTWARLININIVCKLAVTNVATMQISSAMSTWIFFGTIRYSKLCFIKCLRLVRSFATLSLWYKGSHSTVCCYGTGQSRKPCQIRQICTKVRWRAFYKRDVVQGGRKVDYPKTFCHIHIWRNQPLVDQASSLWRLHDHTQTRYSR